VKSTIKKLFGPDCPVDAEVVRMTPSRKAAILSSHNTKRSMLASGQVSGFQKAVQMPQLVSLKLKISLDLLIL
jgi:hypothetical protein